MMFNISDIIVFAGAGIIACCVGVFTGIFGVGGGFMLTPALMFCLGIPGPSSVGSGTAFIFVTSSFGMFKRRGTNTIDKKLAFIMSGGSGLGVVTGLAILECFKDMPPLEIFGREQIAVQFFLLVCFVVLLVSIAVFMLYDCHKDGYLDRLNKGLLGYWRIPPYFQTTTLGDQEIPAIPVILISFGIGLLTGLLGIGGGVVIVPCLIYLLGQNGRNVAGTSLLIIWLSTLIGCIGHLKQGNINGYLLMTMLVGGILGTHYGTVIGLNLDHNRICRFFSYIVGLAAIFIVVKLYKVTLG